MAHRARTLADRKPIDAARPPYPFSIRPRQLPLRSARSEIGITGSGILRVAVVLMLIWHLGPIGPFLEPEYFSAVGAQTTDIQDIVQENQSLRLSWLPVYAITLLLVGRRLPAICRAATWCPLVVALLGLAMVSALWSVSPADTLRRATALTCTSLLGLYLAVRFEPREFIRLFGWTLAVLMALSVVAAAGKPEIGISGQPHPGAWRGVFVTKNGLGQTMLMALVTFLVAAGMSRRRQWPLLGAAAAAALLALSTAKTPVVVAVALALVALLVWMARRNPSRAAYLAAIAATGALAAPIILFVALEPTLALLGRDLTLSGRTEIWMLAWEKIQQQPLLGYGYGAFWSPAGSAVLDIWHATGWLVSSAHNGYLDLLLSFGALGLPLYGLTALGIITRALRTGTQTDPWSALWSICMTTLFLIYGFAESCFMVQNSMAWLLFVVLAAYGGRPAPARAPSRAVGSPGGAALAPLRPASASVPP